MIYKARAEELKKDIFTVDGKLIAMEVFAALLTGEHFWGI